MTTPNRADLMLPQTPDTSSAESRRGRMIALIPIAIALFGVGLIVFGGVRANDRENIDTVNAVDPGATGTVVAMRDRLHDLQMLDR